MWLKVLVFAAILGLPLVTGCSRPWIYPGRSASLQKEIDAMSEYLDIKNVITTYNQKGNDQQTYRNQVIAIHIYAIDLYFHQRLKNSFGERESQTPFLI